MVRVYWESFKQSLKVDLEYKGSFIFEAIANIFLFFTYYFVIIGLFNKFSNIEGYTLYEVLLCFSIIQFGYTFNESFFRGVDKFEDLIIDGALDRLLLRPRNILLQVICSKICIGKIIRIIQAIIILIISLINLNIEWNIFRILTLIGMMLSSILIFFGIFLATASYCFITIHGLEVKNVLTDGGKFMAQYPINIYKKGFVFIFTFILPYAFVNYYPLMYLIGKSTNPIVVLSPLIIILYMIPSFIAFYKGLKHYSSVGS